MDYVYKSNVNVDDAGNVTYTLTSDASVGNTITLVLSIDAMQGLGPLDIRGCNIPIGTINITKLRTIDTLRTEIKILKNEFPEIIKQFIDKIKHKNRIEMQIIFAPSFYVHRNISAVEFMHDAFLHNGFQKRKSVKFDSDFVNYIFTLRR